MSVVILNPEAHGRKALELWARVEQSIHADVIVCDWRRAIANAIRGGERHFIAAGGDGTVNAVLNAIVESRGGVPLGEFALGAVGLGSSNDFHKPAAALLRGIPCRLDAARAAPRDVGLARYGSLDGTRGERCFLVSASIGATAHGNAVFNSDAVVRRLKSRWTGVAIPYAALRAISTYRNLAAEISCDGRREATAIANLSLMKTPYLSGSFRFGTPVPPDDGLFAVKLLEGCGRWRLLRALAALSFGRTRGWREFSAAAAVVESRRPMPVELDGELIEAARVEFAMLPERIRVCP